MSRELAGANGAAASGARPAWYLWPASRVSPERLVLAGVLMFPLYVFADVIASLLYDGYSYADHTISELSAIGAPTRPLWLVVSVFYQVLAFAFAFGVLAVAGQRRTVRIVGWVLFAAAIAGLFWWIAPMHRREVLAAGGDSWQDTLHLVLAGVNTVLFFAMIGVGAFAFGRRFRWYSVATIAVMLVFGMLMNAEVAKVAEDEPTPWLGLWERITVEGAMLWEAMFAAMLLRGMRAAEQGSSASVPT